MTKQAMRVKRFRAGSCKGVKVLLSMPGYKGEVHVCVECKSVTVTGNLWVSVPVGKIGWKNVFPSR